MVEEGIERVLPCAEQVGVKLGIEPLHPAFAADRSVIVTLRQANDIVERLDSPQVGVVIDVYHVWWDPEICREVERAAEHILGFHVNDWLRGVGDPLMSRGMMGDGVIELRRVRESVEAAGYVEPIEVEIFNEEVWAMPGDDVLKLVGERYLEHVL
jgi:sugar phosphate isomerase/epimerase